MVSQLDQAAAASSDLPDAPAVQTTRTVRSGRPGRPRIEIDEELLATALDMRGPQRLGPVLGVCA
jgi:hypothetical protein